MLFQHGPRRGSSPRVRGEVARVGGRGQLEGIIPAGAGRSGSYRIDFITDRDHPRGCGEKSAISAPYHASRGSSPRVRGEVNVPFRGVAACGIIPAGAGRSPTLSSLPIGEWDHPRGCGEKPPNLPITMDYPGSSPRVRGEAGSPNLHALPTGIIPAGAGRSLDRRGGSAGHGDHPRGCGEKLYPRLRVWVTTGSSPRVRGEAPSPR